MEEAGIRRNGEDDREYISVDLHCHSDESDGLYPPDVLAEHIAGYGVQYASLTDHMSTRGLLPFHSSSLQKGMTDIPGAEISTDYRGVEVHLLAYGMNPEDRNFQELFQSIPDTFLAVRTVHEAGGLVFLAHPLNTDWSDRGLQKALNDLSDHGLDGIEAFYKPYTESQQQYLCGLADSLELLTCGGSDYHDGSRDNPSEPGVMMPLRRWKQLSRALGELSPYGETRPAGRPDSFSSAGTVNWKRMLLRFFFPAFIVIASYTLLIFGVLIPTMEERLLDRKREMTTELTNSAWSILSDYERQVSEGAMELEEAQQAAAERIRRMRYGPKELDYFWITDMQPQMIMHPYREDLEGEDLTGFTDPQGNRPFVEFVSKVRSHSSGFVRYVWQWHDDPERMEPKESYVRGFEPWGWIIGTGLYVDDVQEEIAVITGRMIDLSLIAVIGSSLLLFAISYQSLKTERRRNKAEEELTRSHERYETLVESSASGILLLSGEQCTFANSTLLEMLGYREQELLLLDIFDIIAEGNEHSPSAWNLARGEEFTVPAEVRAVRKDGSEFPALITSSKVSVGGVQGLLVSIQDLSGSRGLLAEAERDRLFSDLQASQQFLSRPVISFTDPAASCSAGQSLQDALDLMNREDTGILLVTGESGELAGTVAARDIRSRTALSPSEAEIPVSSIMTAPVITLEEQTPLIEALFLLREKEAEHLAVISSSGKPAGILKGTAVLEPEQYALGMLLGRIRSAPDMEDLARYRDRFSQLVRSLISSGFPPRHICRVISDVSDALTRRIIILALEDMPEVPVPFAFISLGSEARKEQTLATDQDNAIIYDDAGGEEARQYFLELGSRICDTLHLLGFSRCRGATMAKNPRWNQSISAWKKDFSAWIAEPDDASLSRFSVFFDQRCLYGETRLLGELREHIHRELNARPGFLSHAALNTLQYKPPLGLFGQLVTTQSREGREGVFDVKEAMLPIINFARLYASKHHLDQANTHDRLLKLQEIGEIPEKTRRAAALAFEHLLKLRLEHQLELIRHARSAENSIELPSLTQFETGILKQACTQIGMLQKRVSLDFQRG